MPHEFLLTTPLLADVRNPTLRQIAEVAAALPSIADHIIESHSDFLIVSRINDKAAKDTSCAHFMQTRPHRGYGYSGMFLIEVRDGDQKRQYKSYVEAGAPLLAMFQSFLNSDDAWRDLAVWRDISYLFEDLHPHLPPGQLFSSFFNEHELQDAKQKQDNDEWWKYFADQFEDDELGLALDDEFDDDEFDTQVTSPPTTP